MNRIVGCAAVIVLAWWMWPKTTSQAVHAKRAPTSKNEEAKKPKPVPVGVATTSNASPATESQHNDRSAFDLCMDKLSQESRKEDEFLHDYKDGLERVVGAWFFQENPDLTSIPDERSTSGKFLQALGEAKLLEGRERILPNEDHALELLHQVISEEPRNSAPIVYAAIIEERRGNLEAAKSLRARLATTSYYNSFMKDFSNNILEQVKDVRDYLPAISMVSRTPIPAVDPLREFLKSEDDENHVAWQMTRDGRNPKNTRMDFDYMPLEYVLGAAALKNHGKETTPAKEIYQRSRLALDELYHEMGPLGAACALGDLWPVLDHLKQRGPKEY